MCKAYQIAPKMTRPQTHSHSLLHEGLHRASVYAKLRSCSGLGFPRQGCGQLRLQAGGVGAVTLTRKPVLLQICFVITLYEVFLARSNFDPTGDFGWASTPMEALTFAGPTEGLRRPSIQAPLAGKIKRGHEQRGPKIASKGLLSKIRNSLGFGRAPKAPDPKGVAQRELMLISESAAAQANAELREMRSAKAAVFDAQASITKAQIAIVEARGKAQALAKESWNLDDDSWSKSRTEMVASVMQTSQVAGKAIEQLKDASSKLVKACKTAEAGSLNRAARVEQILSGLEDDVKNHLIEEVKVATQPLKDGSALVLWVLSKAAATDALRELREGFKGTLVEAETFVAELEAVRSSSSPKDAKMQTVTPAIAAEASSDGPDAPAKPWEVAKESAATKADKADQVVDESGNTGLVFVLLGGIAAVAALVLFIESKQTLPTLPTMLTLPTIPTLPTMPTMPTMPKLPSGTMPSQVASAPKQALPAVPVTLPQPSPPATVPVTPLQPSPPATVSSTPSPLPVAPDQTDLKAQLEDVK